MLKQQRHYYGIEWNKKNAIDLGNKGGDHMELNAYHVYRSCKG
jgi:hypothetical protein